MGEARAFRLVGDGADVAEANAFLRSLELRGLSPRTVRASAMDFVELLPWLRGRALTARELTDAALLDFLRAQREAADQPRSINRPVNCGCRREPLQNRGAHFRGRIIR
ncbi:hypothetical protein D7Y13_43455 [Corallococcus praedator]|uniref:Core-binding (CB) domain-containing protein n=1 Tax=Corallococcus praedator TaxID=2316724 RepID=A0ABX9Q3H4_9BACT|nr:hypothetical protein D7Y13_43455 [Corallococcus praedator]